MHLPVPVGVLVPCKQYVPSKHNAGTDDATTISSIGVPLIGTKSLIPLKQ
jgi:hypothetical protein